MNLANYKYASEPENNKTKEGDLPNNIVSHSRFLQVANQSVKK